MNKFLKKILSILGSVFVVASVEACSASVVVIPDNLTIKNAHVLQRLNDYMNQKTFKTERTNYRYTNRWSISRTTLDHSKAVPVLRPYRLFDVDIFIPEKNELGKLAGYITIYTQLSPNPERVEDVVKFFNTADSSTFVLTITNFILHGGAIYTFDAEVLPTDEQNPLLFLAYGKKQLVFLQKIPLKEEGQIKDEA
jgi:hypothetical protein